MLITRWQAPTTPSREQTLMIMDMEGLDVSTEIHGPKEKIPEHRHPFTEVRIIIQGELLFNIAGNQFLVRSGDRLEIPANTKHWHQNHGNTEAISLYGQRVF